LIIGAGPAGLHAALELKRRGLEPLLIDRERGPGGAPRYCGHRTFWCRERGRVLKGPDYAAFWTREAERAGIRIEAESTALRLRGREVEITSPAGVRSVAARTILLATGAREAQRHQLLIPGDRPAGVFTSGSLFRFLYEGRRLPGRRFVLYHSEDVSYSVVHAICKAGGEVAAVVEPLAETRSHPAVRWFYEKLRGVPHYFGVGDFAIHGSERVEAVTVAGSRLPCDAVVFTGGFTPNTELGSTEINQWFETPEAGVFAAGNCLRGVVPAHEAAWEGRRAAEAIVRRLSGAEPARQEIRLLVEPPLKQVCPQRLALGVPVLACYAVWAAAHLRDVTVEARQGDRLLWRDSFRRWQPERRAFLPVQTWEVEPGEPIRITAQGRCR
jgi:thioredoxin reductase